MRYGLWPLFAGLVVVLLTACAESDAPDSAETVSAETASANTDSADSGTADKRATPSAAAVAGQRSGEQIVNQYCLTCHGRGLYNAPKLDDVAAWQTRLAAGDAVLWQSLQQGKLAMPARGTCGDCTDDELRAALNHLLAQVRPGSAP